MVDGTIEPGWRPLITDPDRRVEIAAMVGEIVAAVAAWRRDHKASSNDESDYATLRIYAASDDAVPDPDDEAGQALAQAIAGIADRQEPGLYGGAARIAFAVGHLSAGEDADTACEMIERSLLRYLGEPTESYDLISGLVGIAVPVLQRIADGKPSPSSEPIARSILDHLERLARPSDAGLSWHTPPSLLPDWQRTLAPEGYTNLGLAHGIPGIVAILARYLAAGVEVRRARALLEGAVGYLRSVASPTFGARYAAWLPSPRADAQPRVAWCYGDLGVSVALMAAASATAREDWRAEALDLAHGMAARPFDQSMVIDAGLCHGAAGVAHLFNRLAQATGDAELARSAEAWFTRTLEMRRAEPIAGFPRGLPVDGTTTWEPAADLLTGATGVALALHAAISSIEPAWDQLLLADLSPTT
ncbi:MAG TPA: lanthionine synthetase C family protein [Kofleriaceae bacterium]|nr:lanthionine synthetase C family protein [Kofleriaceae bacterium]